MNGMLDILSIEETKLDVSLLVTRFSINSYKYYRKDVICSVNGLILDPTSGREDLLEAEYNQIQYKA